MLVGKRRNEICTHKMYQPRKSDGYLRMLSIDKNHIPEKRTILLSFHKFDVTKIHRRNQWLTHI